MPTSEELLQRLAWTGDPEIDARQEHILEVLLKLNPKLKQRIVEKIMKEEWLAGEREGRLEIARARLRQLLALRQLALGPDDDARIEACTDLATLERWHARALTAASAAAALA